MEHLSDQQIARVEALTVAREVVRTSSSAFGGTALPEVPELVDVAEYIISGTHPMDSHQERMLREAQRGPIQRVLPCGDEVQPDGCGGAVD